MMRVKLLLLSTLLAAAVGFMPADEPAAESPPLPPRVAMLNPPGVSAGATTRVMLRGWNLNDAKAVTADREGVMVNVLKHESAAVPGRQKAEEIGDQQLELEIVLPDAPVCGELGLVVETAAGKSAPARLLIGAKQPVQAEAEPNDSFAQAQLLSVPQLVTGEIHADANVDVYRLELSEPQTIRMQVIAAELGSGLDSLLTLYSAAGNVIQQSDDRSGSRDSFLQLSLAPGTHLLVIQDAHDRGGPAHPYRLEVTAVEAADQAR